MKKVISSIDGKIIKAVSMQRKTYLIKLSKELSVQEAITVLSKQKTVIYAEPNNLMRVR